MQLLRRILCVLVASAVIASITYGLVQTPLIHTVLEAKAAADKLAEEASEGSNGSPITKVPGARNDSNGPRADEAKGSTNIQSPAEARDTPNTTPAGGTTNRTEGEDATKNAASAAEAEHQEDDTESEFDITEAWEIVKTSALWPVLSRLSGW